MLFFVVFGSKKCLCFFCFHKKKKKKKNAQQYILKGSSLYVKDINSIDFNYSNQNHKICQSKSKLKSNSIHLSSILYHNCDSDHPNIQTGNILPYIRIRFNQSILPQSLRYKNKHFFPKKTSKTNIFWPKKQQVLSKNTIFWPKNTIFWQKNSKFWKKKTAKFDQKTFKFWPKTSKIGLKNRVFFYAKMEAK